MTIGTEHEYSINDRDFRPLPINDRIIEELNGEIVNEFQFGDVNLSKELQKNVIKMIVRPFRAPASKDWKGRYTKDCRGSTPRRTESTASWVSACTPP